MRVKSPAHRRHVKLLKQAKGFRMTKNRLVGVAHQALLHSGEYAFAGRHLRRRDLRSLWIVRINAALRSVGIKYSAFIPKLNAANIKLDRKILADLAVRQPKVFNEIIKSAGFTTPK